MGVTDFEVKVEGLGELWRARAVVWVALGSCLRHAVMAMGRRRTKAMTIDVNVELEKLGIGKRI